MVEQNQLWIVVDGQNHWLWYGRGTQNTAIAGAKEAGDYSPIAALYLYAVATEIVIEPVVWDGLKMITPA